MAYDVAACLAVPPSARQIVANSLLTSFNLIPPTRQRVRIQRSSFTYTRRVLSRVCGGCATEEAGAGDASRLLRSTMAATVTDGRAARASSLPNVTRSGSPAAAATTTCL